MIRLLGILLCLLPTLALAADARIGRLFLRPAERAALDVVRQNDKPPEKIVHAGPPAEDETADVAAAMVTVHGYVKRSDGKGTVWINGRPLQEQETTPEVSVGRLRNDSDQVQIRLPGAGQTIHLKVGQSYNPASGKVADNPKDLLHATAPPIPGGAQPAAATPR